MKAFGKLRVRLTAVCAASTGLVLLCMALTSYRFSVLQLQGEAAQRFAMSVQRVLNHVEEQPVITHTWLLNTEAEGNLIIGVLGPSSQLAYGSGDAHRQQLTQLALSTAQEHHGLDDMTTVYTKGQIGTVSFFMDTDHNRYRAAVTPLRVQDNWLIVAVLGDRIEECRQQRQLQLAFAGTALLSLLCLMLFSWFFTRWVTRPVEHSHKKQVAFVGAASHEFRSPVAVIQMSAESIKEAPGHLVERYADMILRECARLGRLTQDMLQLAGADNRNLSIRLEPVNPEALLRNAQEDYQGMAAAKAIELCVRLPQDPLPKTPCDRERIEQVLAILLDNALQYTPAGGVITLEAARAPGGIRLSVADTGPGIPDSEKSNIFERFYRGDRARSDKEHYGLGLSIAREIMELHGGTVTVADGPDGGSVFFLFLPGGKKSR